MSEPHSPADVRLKATGIRTVAREVPRPGSGTPASPEDRAVIEKLLAGDEAAFGSLVERYHGQLLRLALVFVSDRMAAEEVVQETWLGVLNGLKSFEGRSALKTWIFRILTNRAKTRGVRERRSIPFSALGDPDLDHEPAVDPDRFTPQGMWADPPHRLDEDSPESLLLRKETMAAIAQAIAELPANQRAVLTMRDIEGLDADEVCNILEISETNQRVLLHRARSRLRLTLERDLGRR